MSDKPKKIPAEETRISAGGNLRCCLTSVATEFTGKNVSIGERSACKHCGTKFTLKQLPLGPMWIPEN